MYVEKEFPKAERSLTDILGQLIDQVTSLIRSESALARTEMGEALSKIVGDISTLIVGAVLVLPALVILLEAAVGGLIAAGLIEPWASLIVGGVVFVIGVICVAVGMSRLKSVSLVPKETIKQLQLDVAVVQEVGKNHDA